MRIIKRYRNRRLYDTERKSYITHAELSAIIGSGEPFQVVDSDSGEDITVAVLGQLFIGNLRDERDAAKAKETLIELINKGGEKSMSILRNTYLAGVGMLNLTRKKAEEIIDQLIKEGQINKSEKKDAVMELLDKAEEHTKKYKDKVLKEAGDASKNFSKMIDKFKLASRNDLQALEKKIDLLTKKLDKLNEK
jgi:polyhydroxyalkanoate synthesis repressor PhaR